ncbi:MAG TPA: GNAT family N-acetyltransferase [Proteiniclasticum sp.]|uniref:GNAT family N-acetyltransferase n=1 Tax=Proteiniclasticum sp. TaxID=2053595 RepID=UPI000E861516|nr:GNAT family N-acetyltransferase [Proteiniclasticum sp.]HBW14306.1 GNAT family N-acetyltransferase [Proteiniclasticum sp.]
MKIRGYRNEDLKKIEEIWLKGNKEAHAFVSEEFFFGHLPMLRELMPKVTVLVSEEEDTVTGFLGMEDGFILGLFVDPIKQGQGIGRKLLQEAKRKTDVLTLKAFVKNERAVAFYKREGFTAAGTEVDETTGEEEVTFVWKK